MAARRSHTASVVGSPDWKSPPKKVNRYALSAVETNADTRQLGSREMPATASCDGLFTGSVTTPSKHGYSRDDLEQLVQLFTPLSVKLPRRTRSCEHVSPNSVKAQQNSSRLPAVDAPVDVVVELSKFPCWLSYSLAEALCRQTDDTQPFMTTKWFTTLAQCVELGHEATLVYLKSTIPAVLWSEDIVLAANHPFWLNNHLQPPSVCPVVSVTLSGESGPSLTPFNCQLSLKLERCGRAFREFGWFSFVEVSLPKLPTTQLKSSFVRLVSIGFTLLGQRYTYLFGKCGEWKCWFTRLSPGSVLHWHIPEGPDNVEMSVNQRWSRMNMAFSKAYPTAVAIVSCDASDDIRVMQEGDVHSCVGGVALKQYGPAASSCMTDGCGWISHSAMMRVMSRCPSGRDTTLPFAIQGRFGEWKGVWLCQPDHVVACGSKHWIVVRRSMQKWTIPCSVRTRSQSTIEVLKWSHPGSIASLNRQFIAVLAMNGVSTEVLLDMCQCAVNTLTAASSSRSQALQACEFLHGNPLHSDIIRLVHCGLWEEPYTQHRLKSACRTIVESMTAHHHIPVVHSRYALIVPDPTGLLSENEVYFRSSTKLQLCDAETDSRTVIGDVIIARNPCYYPSDMRKVTAVDLLSRIARDDTLASSYEWWRDVCVDVIVCPVAGPCSLASLMSGGDYDGDLAWICWDCRLTSQWKCVEYKCHDCSVAMAASVSSSRDVHMQHLYVNSLQTSTLSMSSNLLLAWMDALFAMADPSSEEVRYHPAVLALASTCAGCVDASKTGFSAEISVELRSIKYPHYLKNTTHWSKGYRKSTSVLGLMFDACEAALTACTACSMPPIPPSPHPVILGIVDTCDWKRYVTAANSAIAEYNAAVVSVMNTQRKQAINDRLTHLKRITRQKLYNAHSADWTAFVIACYCQCYVLAASARRYQPYKFVWDVLLDDVLTIVS